MHVCTYVYTNECVDICMCFHRLSPRILQLQLSVFIWVRMGGYIDIYTYIYINDIYMYVYVHLYIYVYMYICICIQMCTCTCTCMCFHRLPPHILQL